MTCVLKPARGRGSRHDVIATAVGEAILPHFICLAIGSKRRVQAVPSARSARLCFQHRQQTENKLILYRVLFHRDRERRCRCRGLRPGVRSTPTRIFLNVLRRHQSDELPRYRRFSCRHDIGVTAPLQRPPQHRRRRAGCSVFGLARDHSVTITSIRATRYADTSAKNTRSRSDEVID